MTSQAPSLTVVVPCLNEEEGVKPFLDEMAKHTSRLPPLEVIFVDDGSTDKTVSVIRDQVGRYEFGVGLVKLSRNFGHQLALLAGMRAARGSACVTMDVDLQDPPEVIIEMVKKWREGFAVVIGQRADRSTDTWFKRTSAALFYRLISYLTNGSFPENVGDFRLIDRKVLDIMCRMPDSGPYWRGLAVWVGFPRAMVSYSRQARQTGETKFPLRKMILFALNAMFSFSRKPLQVASLLGIGVSVLCFATILVHLVMMFMHQSFVPGWLSTISLLGLVGGIQLICIGILGEYVGRIYELSLGRPNVIVEEAVVISEPKASVHRVPS